MEVRATLSSLDLSQFGGPAESYLYQASLRLPNARCDRQLAVEVRESGSADWDLALAVEVR